MEEKKIEQEVPRPDQMPRTDQTPKTDQAPHRTSSGRRRRRRKKPAGAQPAEQAHAENSEPSGQDADPSGAAESRGAEEPAPSGPPKGEAAEKAPAPEPRTGTAAPTADEAGPEAAQPATADAETPGSAAAEPEPAEPTQPEPAEPAAEEPAAPAPEQPAAAEPGPADTEKTAQTADAAQTADTSDTADEAETPDEAETLSGPEAAEAAQEGEPVETEAHRRRTAEMTRTVRLSIEKMMEALPAEPAPDAEPETTPDEAVETPDDETPSPTVAERLASSAWGVCKWMLLVLAFVAVVAGVGIGWLYRGATEDLLPEISASFAGQTLETAAYDWKVPVVGDWFKRTYAAHISKKPQQLAEVQSSTVPLSIRADNCDSWLTIQNADEETVFDGAGEEFVTFAFTENGDYTAELTVYRTETGLTHEAGVSGSQTYRFAFSVNLRPTFRLNTGTVQQGGVAALRVTGVSEKPVLTTELTATPFYAGRSGWVAYLPIEVDREPGDYTLTVQAAGFTQEYTLTVRQRSTQARDYAWRSELTTPYLSADETPAEVTALLTTADPSMAWADSGFVQPFLSTIEVTLPYGTTEYVGRTVSQRQSGTGSGRTSTNAVITGKRGDALIAPADGRVLLAENLGGTAGNTLVIEHGGGVKSIFYRLQTLQVKAGDTVGIGQQIATTDKVTIGEVRIGTVPVDPLSIWRGLCDAMRYY